MRAARPWGAPRSCSAPGWLQGAGTGPARPPSPTLGASPVPAYRRVEAQVADVAGDELLLLQRGGHAEGVADHRLLHRVHLEGEEGTGWLGGTGTRSTHPAVLSVCSRLPGTSLGSHRPLLMYITLYKTSPWGALHQFLFILSQPSKKTPIFCCGLAEGDGPHPHHLSPPGSNGDMERRGNGTSPSPALSVPLLHPPLLHSSPQCRGWQIISFCLSSQLLSLISQ